MKKIIFILAFLTIGSFTLPAQPPPAPPSNAGNGGNGPVGGGAPVDGGLATALVMVAGFGAWKLFNALQKKKLSDYHNE